MAEFLTNLNERNARQLCNTFCLMDVIYFLRSIWWYIWLTSLASATCSFLSLTKTSTMSLRNLGPGSDSPLHQEPGQAGVDRGNSQAWKPGFGHVGQRIKKPGNPRPHGQHGLAWPRLARAKIEKEKHKTLMVCMAWTGRGWPGSKLAKPGKEKQKSLAYNWPALAAAGWAKIGQAC